MAEPIKEHLRFKYTPRIANCILDWSTARARARLAHLGRIKILVDNTVLHHAVTHETTQVSIGPTNAGSFQMKPSYSARVPVHSRECESRDYRHVRYLTGIAHLCRRGFLDLFTSAELGDEQFRQPRGRYRGYGYFDYSLFSDLDIKSIDGFVFPTIGPLLELPSPQCQQLTRLEKHKRDQVYAELVKCLGPKHSQDAWHIYTAEKHQMFCFLTMDFKLIDNVTAQSRSKPLKWLKTLVLTPEAFGKRFGLLPVPPIILSYNGASFFVRPDLSMPNNRRRPLKAYRRD